MGDRSDEYLARKGRIVGVVIACGGLLAIIAPWLTTVFGLAVRFEMLLYMISLAAFVWALAVTYQIWRARRDNRG
ncbi:DUF5337 domain-containing protein [Roseovarius pacificus]|uniref:DUF5337 domain-containing protein n=1 Tax=Roseovarius pacificus TaxID=337701 RepID=UPI004039020B